MHDAECTIHNEESMHSARCRMHDSVAKYPGMKNGKENLLKEKSYEFALRIISLYKHLTAESKEYVLSKQVLRSGTSIGANITEANRAQSKMDFVHKLSIALKRS
jgi:hypothetical protein